MANLFDFDDGEQELQFGESDSESLGTSEPSKQTATTEQPDQADSPCGEKQRPLANNFQDDEGDFVVLSIQKRNLGRVYGARGGGARHCSHENSSKRISVSDFSIPKFTMRLAANQGNPKQLAALLAAKQTKKSRVVPPKLEYWRPVTPREAILHPSDESSR